MVGGVELVCVADFERLAESRLEPGAFGFYAGGAGDERVLRGNVAAWERLSLRPRVLVDVSEVSTATTVLGTPVSMPLLVAPVALQRRRSLRRRGREWRGRPPLPER